jgi:hypothetical protein
MRATPATGYRPRPDRRLLHRRNAGARRAGRLAAAPGRTQKPRGSSRPTAGTLLRSFEAPAVSSLTANVPLSRWQTGSRAAMCRSGRNGAAAANALTPNPLRSVGSQAGRPATAVHDADDRLHPISRIRRGSGRSLPLSGPHDSRYRVGDVPLVPAHGVTQRTGSFSRLVRTALHESWDWRGRAARRARRDSHSCLRGPGRRVRVQARDFAPAAAAVSAVPFSGACCCGGRHLSPRADRGGRARRGPLNGAGGGSGC